VKLGAFDTRTFRSKVARRTFTLFIACALIPVSALALLSFEQVSTQLNEQSQQRLHQATKAAALGIYQRLLSLQEAIVLTASGLRSRSGPTGPLPDARVDEQSQRHFKSMVLVTEAGTRVPLFGHLDRLPALTAEQQRHLASGKTLLVVAHAPNRPPRFFLGRVRDPERPHRDILYAEIDPAYLWGFDDEVTLAPLTKLSVVDQSLNLLFASPQAPTSFPRPVALQLSRSISGRFEWSDDTNEYVARYFSLSLQFTFSTSRWTIVLSESKADVLAPIAGFKRNFFLVILLFLWIVLLLSITQIRRSLVPLEKLQEGTRRIARGAFDTRVDIASRDEFEELAVSLNTMAHQLGRQFTALTMMGEISLALGRNLGLEEALRQCADILVRHLDLAVVRVWILNSDERVLELRASAGLSSRLDGAESRVPLGQSAIGRIAEERRPRVTNALVENSGSEQEWAAREGLVAFVGHPLLVEGRLVGVAAAYARTPLDEVGLSGFVSAAGEIAQCIERQRVEEALRGSEEQVRQLQKMEAVGRLAGGVAHDFNNLLTVITGHSQLLLRRLPPGDPLREGLDLIEATAVRAGWLTRQLLAFSRKQNLAPVVLDPNEVVSGMATMLQRLIGEDVELVFRPGSSLGRVRVDPGQLEQVIVNLVVNARDAMPEGGRITVETAGVELDDDAYARMHVGVRAGWSVMLAVTDTGIGMDAETQSHIFEPFFTTKEPGKGTGLGLATVYGIVKQSDGHIRVQSQPGEGTTFKIYLPLVDAPLGQPARAAPLGQAPEGAETILLVEDQADVRLVVRRVLQNAGYTVLDASTPGDALELAGRHTGPIHLTLTDIVMPQMNGRALADLLKRRCPAMRVLYMSGYADTVLDPGTAYLQKPFTPDTLVRTVREVLDTVAETSR
jgi:signal transduction histidine kinase